MSSVKTLVLRMRNFFGGVLRSLPEVISRKGEGMEEKVVEFASGLSIEKVDPSLKF